MSEQTRMIDLRIAPDGQLGESNKMANERRNTIGTNMIDKKRRADVTDTYNVDGSENQEGWNLYANERFVDKEGLDDHDLREVVSARLDERMLEIGSSSMDTTARIKAYDDLSRVKSFIQFINVDQDGSLQDSVVDARDAFREKGDADMAEIADAANRLLHETSLEALDLQGGGEGEGAHVETKRVIDEHNERVTENKKRFSAEGERRSEGASINEEARETQGGTATASPNVSEYRPLSDDEVAAAKAQVDEIMTSSTLKSRETDTKHESPAELHEPHYNIVETVPEARDLIYSNPDYLSELIDESEAYAMFSADKLDADNAVISANMKIMERDLADVRQAMQNWRKTSGMNFKQYIEAVGQDDIEATQDQKNAAYSAKMMLRNTFWRESSMARRMAKKRTDNSGAGDIEKAFDDEYFHN